MRSFAGECGMSDTVIRQYLSGKSEPTRPAIIAIARISGCSINWLLTGEGGMRPGDTYAVTCAEYKATPLEGFVQIPRYKVSASAGGGSIIHSEQIVDHLTFRSDWVRNALGVPVSSLALINVKGDSMEPTLSNGDVILIDMSAEGVDDNAVYVLRYDGKLVVKRIQRRHDGSITVKGDNPVYEPETISGELVNGLDVVGRVVWCGRRM